MASDLLLLAFGFVMSIAGMLAALPEQGEITTTNWDL
jgi:hypothetical protein